MKVFEDSELAWRTEDMAASERPANDLPDAVLASLRQVSVGTLSSQLLKRGFRNTFLGGLSPTRPDLRLVGYAFTLRYVPAREDLDMRVEFDNLTNVQRLAVEAVGPGDVLVIDARGEIGAGSLGNILATRIKARGGAGVVTDGALRDANTFPAIDLPVYSRGTHAAVSSVLHHPADLNVPIGCAGVLVMPGDIIVGDPDGVIAIPRAIAAEVAGAALEQEGLEAFILGKIQSGSSIRGVYPAGDRTRAEFEARFKP